MGINGGRLEEMARRRSKVEEGGKEYDGVV